MGKAIKEGLFFIWTALKQHGLLAAPTDIVYAAPGVVGVAWNEGATFPITNAVGTAVGTGKANTAKIIAVQGAGTYAAKLCDDLVVGIYQDWYLPSKDELNLMYTNIGQGAAAPLTNVGNFSHVGIYWSSSEYSATAAWLQNFVTGSQNNNYGKNSTTLIRAVRTF